MLILISQYKTMHIKKNESAQATLSSNKHTYNTLSNNEMEELVQLGLGFMKTLVDSTTY